MPTLNEYQQGVEAGKEILRKEKINFTEFKKQMLEHIKFKQKADEDSWVDWYNSFAWFRARYEESLSEWIEDFYSEFTIEKHGMQLKSSLGK